MNELTLAWLHAQKFDVDSSDYDEACWAIDELFDLAHDDHRKLLDAVLDILRIDSSEKVLNALGAGVLEDLLVHNGDTCIDVIDKLAESNKNFKNALMNTFIDRDDVSPFVFEVLQKIRLT